MFDTVHGRGLAEQVKLWGRSLAYVHVGQWVGRPRGGLAPSGTYSVAMDSGGYLHVINSALVAWDDQPGPLPVLDTYGGPNRPDGLKFPGAPEDCRCAEEAPRGPRSEYLLAVEEEVAEARALARGSDEERVDAARLILASKVRYVGAERAALAALLGFELSGSEPTMTGTPALLEALVLEATGATLGLERLGMLVGALSPALPATLLSALLGHLAELVSYDDSDTFDHAFGEMYYRDVVLEAVAAHGSAVFTAVPLRFLADAAADSLLEPAVVAALGRPLRTQEARTLTQLLGDVDVTLADLTEEHLEAALRTWGITPTK